MANKDDMPRVAFDPNRFELLESKDIKLYFLWDKEHQKQVMVFDGDLVITGNSYATDLCAVDDVHFASGPLQDQTGIIKL